MKHLIFLLVPYLLFAGDISNLGTYGELYPIEEEDFMEELKRGAAKMDKDKMKEDLVKDIKKQTLVSSSLGFCLKTRTRVFEPIATLKEQIGASGTPVYFPVGYSFNRLKLMREHGIVLKNSITFIDTTEPLQISLAKDQVGSELLVGNGDIKDAISINNKANSATILLEDFGIECFPSVITQDGDYLKIQEFNYDTLKARYIK